MLSVMQTPRRGPIIFSDMTVLFAAVAMVLAVLILVS
jgi:hypothetical protein